MIGLVIGLPLILALLGVWIEDAPLINLSISVLGSLLLAWIGSAVPLWIAAFLLVGAFQVTRHLVAGLRCPQCGDARAVRCVRIRPFGLRYYLCRACGGRWKRAVWQAELHPIKRAEQRLFPATVPREAWNPQGPAESQPHPLDPEPGEEPSGEEGSDRLATLIRLRKQKAQRRHSAPSEEPLA